LRASKQCSIVTDGDVFTGVAEPLGISGSKSSPSKKHLVNYKDHFVTQYTLLEY
jgi:hypothetical protein